MEILIHVRDSHAILLTEETPDQPAIEEMKRDWIPIIQRELGEERWEVDFVAWTECHSNGQSSQPMSYLVLRVKDLDMEQGAEDA